MIRGLDATVSYFEISDCLPEYYVDDECKKDERDKTVAET